MFRYIFANSSAKLQARPATICYKHQDDFRSFFFRNSRKCCIFWPFKNPSSYIELRKMWMKTYSDKFSNPQTTWSTETFPWLAKLCAKLWRLNQRLKKNQANVRVPWWQNHQKRAFFVSLIFTIYHWNTPKLKQQRNFSWMKKCNWPPQIRNGRF